jgi:anti-sigma factor RsiW
MSATARDTKECLRLERWITAYIDDQLDAVHILEVEEHLGACETCREQTALTRAVRGSLCKATAMRAPAALREKICAAMVAERKHEAKPMAAAEQKVEPGRTDDDARAAGGDEDDGVAGGWLGSVSGSSADASSQPVSPKLVKLRYVMPLAAVATVALVIGAYQLRDHKDRHAVAHQAAASSAPLSTSSFDKFIDDLVEAHIQPPPPEVTDYDGLDRFNPYLGVRVPRPQLSQLGARYLGARMHRHAAMLQYSVADGRRRVTLYVFDPTRMPVQANRLEPVVVGNNHLFVGHVRGYAVAASERDGIGYALASDLPDKDTEQLLVAAAR